MTMKRRILQSPGTCSKEKKIPQFYHVLQLIPLYFFTAEECKKRWGNIRDTFRRHKNKKKLPTGSSTAQKLRKWHLEGYLEFLNQVETERE